MDEQTNRDGYIYPPAGNRNDIPASPSPPLLHRPTASHSVVISDCEPDDAEFGFLAHVFGFACGYRVQFEEFWFDGRVRMKPIQDFHATEVRIQRFVVAAHETWSRWSETGRELIANVLYLLGRAPIYEFAWEEYLTQYMGLDALYKVGKTELGWGHGKHAKRAIKLCKAVGVRLDEPVIEEIVDARNNLFHEARWLEGSPANGGGHFELGCLRRLNYRLVVGLLWPTGESDYVSSSWTTLGTSPL